jgi:predicted phosphoribosyltransferase
MFGGFRDRREAGRLLATSLPDYAGRSDVVVLALPRGGVPVAAEVAAALGAPLDILLVRKLGVPGHEELAMGAIGSGDLNALNDDVIHTLGVSREEMTRVVERERRELERREQLYRGDRPFPRIAGNVVILVDDGLATGASMLVAIESVRAQGAAAVVVAVPVGPRETCTLLAEKADRVVCYATPKPFGGVGSWYQDFTQIGDDEVRALLTS